MKFFKRKEKKERGKKIKILKIILLIVIIVAAVYLILWKTGTLETLRIAKEVQKQQAIAAEDQKVLKDLKKIIDLPEDVQPLMAKVTDADALREQNKSFFEKSKNGDRLIVYPDMAILYDAEINKILKVGPVNFGQGAIGKVDFVIYNGTGDAAKAEEFTNKLKETFNNAEVVASVDAAEQYDETLVVDLVGDNQEISKIADSLNGQVSDLPEGEIQPQEGAVLIILGKNQ